MISRWLRCRLPIWWQLAPLANFWSHLIESEISNDDQIPAGEVTKVIQDTLALIGNASNYVSNTRQSRKSRPKLGTFMKEVCTEDLGDTGSDLFGPVVRKKLTERANTIEAFNKAIATVDQQGTSKSTGSNHLRMRRTEAGRARFHTPHTTDSSSQKGHGSPGGAHHKLKSKRNSQIRNSRVSISDRRQLASSFASMVQHYRQPLGAPMCTGLCLGIL